MSNKRLVIAFVVVLAILASFEYVSAQAVPTYSNVSSVSSPPSRAAAITPNDTTDLPAPCRAIWVGGVGNLVVDFVDGGTSIALNGATAGQFIWARVKRVRTASTATNMVCLY